MSTVSISAALISLHPDPLNEFTGTSGDQFRPSSGSTMPSATVCGAVSVKADVNAVVLAGAGLLSPS